MKCPFCSHEESKVLDSRDSEEDKTRRRRECENCGKRFTTYERIEGVELWVAKKDGRRERFNREKVLRGIEKACEKRPISHDSIEHVVDDIEKNLQAKEAGNDIPSKAIGEAIMEKLKELDQVAYIRFASVYRQFKDIESFEKELDNLKVFEDADEKANTDSTDVHLMVHTATEGITSKWDRSRITNALVKETKLDQEQADEIAKAVEKKVAEAGIKTISVSLLRELVNNELFSRGLNRKLSKQEILGMPTYNLQAFLFSKSVENSNVLANNPEAVNMAIAENTLKQFALKEVFSKDVSEAHLHGALHLHDLGYITRVYCSSHSIEYIKKYGLLLDNLSTKSAPAHHMSTLTGHLNTFLASMQAYYAGALGLGFLNIFYAPFVRGLSDKVLRQQAQYLIYSCSQNAFSRGGQSLVPQETIWIKEDGVLKQVKIGELVDNQLVGAPSYEQWRDGTQITRNNLRGMQAVCFDNNGKISTQTITAFARIPFIGKIYSFETGNGLIKGVTGCHSVFVWNGKEFAAKKAGELREGDYIIAAKNTEGLQTQTEDFDAADFYLKRKESDNIRVFDEKQEFKKALEKKYGNGFYREYEKETGVKAECVRSNWLRYKKIPLKNFVEEGCTLEGKTLLYKGDSQRGIPTKFKVSESFARLLGYYASEGHNNEKRKTFVAVSNKDEKVVKRVVECIDNLGFESVVSKNSQSGVSTVSLCGMLGKLLSDLCEEKGVKKLPEIIYSSAKEVQTAFLEAFFEGDGLKSRKKFAIASTSENLVNGIAMLLAMQGKSSHVYRREYENENWKPVFELREEESSTRVIGHKLGKKEFGRKGLHVESAKLSEDLAGNANANGFSQQQVQSMHMLLEADVCFARIRKISVEEYAGFVYDISVPPKESFLGGTGLLFFHNTLFIDFNTHLGVPDYLKEVAAVCPGGKYVLQHEDGSTEEFDEVPRDEKQRVIQPKKGRFLTYKDFEKETQRFAKALMDVWREGDSQGVPFPFPKNDLHVDQNSFDDPAQRELLMYACEIASENGNPYFFFDREAASLSQCCRLKTKLEDMTMIERPELIRFCGFQNVTINLPQAAYSGGDLEGTIKEVHKAMDLAKKAHLQKKAFIKKLLEPGAPLSQIGTNALDGTGPYMDLEKSTYILGMVGLNECVKHLTGKALHESHEAYKMGIKVITSMYLKAKQFEKEEKMKFTLEESPAESASLRLAKVDLARFPLQAKKLVRGDLEKGEVYYSNSVHLQADAPVSITKRIEMQGKFNNIIESGCITHVFLGEQKPDPKAIFTLVKKTWENTQSAQITISPEFTVCNDCHKVGRGYKRPQATPVPVKA